MNKICLTLLAIFLLHTSIHAADKIRISTPPDAAHFTMHLAEKRGFLKEEGFDAELVIISGPVANVALSNGDTDYFSGFRIRPARDPSGLAASNRCLLPSDAPFHVAIPAKSSKPSKILKARPSGFAHSVAVPIWSGGLSSSTSVSTQISM